jgi:hypothetical protein
MRFSIRMRSDSGNRLCSILSRQHTGLDGAGDAFERERARRIARQSRRKRAVERHQNFARRRLPFEPGRQIDRAANYREIAVSG